MAEKDGSKTDLPNSCWNSRFYNNPRYSDVTIKIFDVVFHAHQIVICDQSEYFERALIQNGPQQFIEAETKTIEFKEGSGAAYWRVFEYLYTGDYSDQLSTTEFSDDPDLLKDVRVYALADMFLIEPLKALAESKFVKRTQDYQLDDSFFACVREVYKSTCRQDSPMRRAVAVVAVNKSKKLAQNFINKSIEEKENLNKLRSLIGEGGSFAEDYMLCSIGLRPVHVEEPIHVENPKLEIS
ncbi:hypothetical protein K3495_g6548 [Podosphaera aphanis]|nr:hypothetical protein K3495_g6548 [Podosphaera aphanis]